MSVGEINVKLGLDTSAFSSGLLAAKAQALALGGSLGDIGKAFSTMGSSAGGSLSKVGSLMTSIGGSATILTAGLVALGAAAVVAGAQMAKMAADYQQAMAKVGATTGQSNQQLRDMQELMYKNAATGSRLGMTAQANIAAGLGGAGLITTTTSPQDQLAQIKLVERAMVALEAPTDDVIQLFSTLQTRYGATTEGMERAASSIATMADETSASNSEIVQASLTMGRLSGTVKMTIPEMVALAAATKSSGIEAAEVGTQWSSLTRNLMSNSEDTVMAFQELGMSQEDYFAALRESKNTGSNAPVLKFLVELDKRLQKSNDSAKLSAQLYGSYGATLGGSIAQVVAKYDQLTVSSQKAYDDNVRLTQEYERMTNTMNSLMDAIGAKFNAIAVKLGTVLLAPIQDATYQLDQFLGKLMMGDMAGAWKGLYDALLNYDWVGAGVTIVSAIGSGLMGLASFMVNAVVQAAAALLTHDWVGSGRSIADKVVSGFQSIQSGISGVMSNFSSWVSSGGARTLGENLGNWIVSGLQSVWSAGVDLYGWLSKNITADKITGVLRSAFTGLTEIAKLGIQAGQDFLSGLGKALTDGASAAWGNALSKGSQLVTDATRLGQTLANALTTGIAQAANAALNPLITQFNNMMATIGQYSSKLGITMPQLQPLQLQGTNYGGAGTDYRGAYSTMKDNLFGGGMVNQGANSPYATGYASLEDDPTILFKQYAAAGMTFDEAMAQFNRDKKAGVFRTTDEFSLPSEQFLKPLFGAGAAATTGNPLDAFSNLNPALALSLGLSGARNTAKYTTSAGTSGAGAMTNLANQWGGGVVPVFVTNWGDGGAGGASATGGATGGTPGTTTGGLFNAAKLASVTSAGIGRVADTSGNVAYKDIVQASAEGTEICMVDEFGMTPGLGKALAEGGVWKPIEGSGVSDQIKKAIGYTGPSSTNTGALIGNIGSALNNATVKSANTQVGTANKVSTIQLGTANKIATINTSAANKVDTSFQIGTSSINRTYTNAAQTGDRINDEMEKTAYSCFTMWGEGVDETADDWCTGVDTANAANLDNATKVRDLHFEGGKFVKDSSVAMGEGLKADFKTIGETAKADIGSATAGLNTTMTGLMPLIASMGGLFGYAGIASGGTGSDTFWGSKTGIGGGGAWVGQGIGATTLNTSSPYYASWGGAAASASIARSSGSSVTISGGIAKIGKYASGGIPSIPQLAMVAENGPEVIAPVGELPTIMGRAMAAAGGGGGHTHAIYMDGKRVADAVGAAMVSRTRQGAGLKVR